MNNVSIANQIRENKYFHVNIKILKMVFGHTVNNVMMEIMIQEMAVTILKSPRITVVLMSLISLQFVINVQKIV